jgi:hypothetical protein
VPAITAIGKAAALKIAIRPAMLNHAATPAIARAVINVRIPKNIYIFTWICFCSDLILSIKTCDK